MRHVRRPLQRGQIAPVALFGVLIASAALVMMYNTGQKVTERSLVANAADAAAFSGAVWTARHLNFMAYTNRAMVANHAAVGHFISYVSWTRYAHQSAGSIGRVTQWMPYVGHYIDVVERVAAQVRSAAEQSARASVPAIDAWNANFRAAQIEVQASLALSGLNDLMQQTARAYDPQIRINDQREFVAMPAELRTIIDTQLLAQLANVPAFVQRYTAGADRNAIAELISANLRTTRNMQRWISGERGWRENLLVVQLRKQGGTSTTQSGSRADWQATDQLQYRTRRLFGWSRWRRLGWSFGGASAQEFARHYAGTPQYYNVAGAPGDRSLSIVAVATKRQSQVRTADLLGMTSRSQPLAVAALARVQFRRPDGAFPLLQARTREYANLFNPFWEARLAPLEQALGR